MKVEASDLQRVVKRTSKYLTRVEPFVCDGHTIRAYSREQGIEFRGSQDYGRFSVRADLFQALLPKKGPIDLSVDLNAGKIFIATDTANQSINLVPPVEYEFPEEPKSFKDVPPEFMGAINKVTFAMSDDRSRTRIRGVFVRDDRFYATDNRRIVRYTSKIDHRGEAVIPDTLLNLVSRDKGLQGYAQTENLFWMKFYEGKDSKEDALKQVSEDTWISFANKVVNPFPTHKLDQAIDAFPKNEKFVEYDQSRLIGVVKRAMPLVGPPRQIDLKLEKDKMVVETQTADGSFKEQIDVRYASKSISVKLPLFISGVERFSRFAYDPNTNHMYFKNDEGLEMLMLGQRSETKNNK